MTTAQSFEAPASITIIVRANTLAEEKDTAAQLFEELPVNTVPASSLPAPQNAEPSFQPSFEDQQVDAAVSRQQFQKLFITRPSQAGLDPLLIGELTDAAHDNPESTFAVVEGCSDDKIDDTVRLESFRTFISKKGVQVFPSMEEFKKHVISNTARKHSH